MVTRLPIYCSFTKYTYVYFFGKNAGQGRRPGHQTPHPGGIARKRNSCCGVPSGCHHTFWSSIFLKKNFWRIFVPKAQEKHFIMPRSDFFHGFGGPQHAKNAKNGCFWAKNNIQNVVEGYARMEKFYFGNSISSLFGGPICQILSFGWEGHGDQQHYFAEKRPSKNRPLRPKNYN